MVNENWNNLSHDVKDVILYGDNDYRLQDSKHAVLHNLRKKTSKGKYDSEKAKNLWGYHADRVARSYHQDFGDKNTKWHEAIKASDRKKMASHWESHHKDELKEHADAISNLVEGCFEKKPVVVQENFNNLILNAVTNLVEAKKQEIRLTLPEVEEVDADESLKEGNPLNKSKKNGLAIRIGNKNLGQNRDDNSRQQVIAAKKSGRRTFREDEELNELSKGTLNNYIKDAQKETPNLMKKAFTAKTSEEKKELNKKAVNRIAGVNKAKQKVNEEELTEISHKLAINYIKKAKQDMKSGKHEKDSRKIHFRDDGIRTAFRKLDDEKVNGTKVLAKYV